MALLEHVHQAKSGQKPNSAQALTVTPEAQASRQQRRLRWRTSIVLALIALAFIKQIVLVAAYPAFQGHDEVAHLGYLSTIANQHRLPTFDDALPAALEEYSRFTLDWPALYTANHPPLYYVVAWPAYALAGGGYV